MINVKIKKKLFYFDLDVNFDLNKEVLVLKGPSGSGKTTVLNCIAGLDKPDGGTIMIDDEIVYSSRNKIDYPARDRNISYVFQNFALFPHMTVFENILFGVNKRNKEDLDYVRKLMDIFGISHLKDRKSNCISGGEKQRTALARALATKPHILLMDEPFSSLDAKIKSTLYDEFLELKNSLDIGVILVTHDPHEAKVLGDRIVNIKEGSCIYDISSRKNRLAK